MELNLLFKKLHPDAILPHKAHDSDLGWDFHCVMDTEFGQDKNNKYTYLLWPGSTHLFHTGVALAGSSEATGLVLFDRSGMATKQYVHLLAGVIDPDYRGEIMVCLFNLGNSIVEIATGDKIIQGILVPVIQASAQWIENDSLSTARGTKGFGSSGG